MTFQEKVLYHQISPLKLSTDWITAFISLYFFWKHNLLLGLIVGFVPPILASFLIMQFVNIEKLKKSLSGQYIAKYMTKQMQVLRLVGYFLMVLGAWWHFALLIIFGLGLILLVWFRGTYRKW